MLGEDQTLVDVVDLKPNVGAKVKGLTSDKQISTGGKGIVDKELNNQFSKEI